MYFAAKGKLIILQIQISLDSWLDFGIDSRRAPYGNAPEISVRLFHAMYYPFGYIRVEN